VRLLTILTVSLVASLALANPPTFSRGPYTVELWGRNAAENNLLRQQLPAVGGDKDYRRIGAGDTAFRSPFLGKIHKAMNGIAISMFKRVAIEPRRRGQRAVELDVKDRTLIVRPKIRRGKVSTLSADEIGRQWDNGAAVGLSGWKMLFRKGRKAREMWKLAQPVGDLRVMLRNEVTTTAEGLIKRIKSLGKKAPAVHRQELQTMLGGRVLKEYRSQGVAQPLAQRLEKKLSRASPRKITAFMKAYTSFLESKENRAGMADAVFALRDRPMAPSTQTQSALLVVSQVLNDKSVDVKANISLAGNRARFTRYLPTATQPGEAAAPAHAPQQPSRTFKEAVVRLIDRIHNPANRDHQRQRALVAVSQVLLRDDIRVQANIGVGAAMATAAAEHALGQLQSGGAGRRTRQ